MEAVFFQGVEKLKTVKIISFGHYIGSCWTNKRNRPC